MVDNVPITAGTGTSIATDDVAGVHFQKVKLDGGGDGASTPILAGQQTMASSLPVTIASDQGALAVSDGGGSVTVDGTVTANAGAGPWPVTDNGGSLTVDGTVSISGTVTVDTELPAAAALADAAANPTTPIIGGANLVYNGTTWDRARGDTANGLDVDVTRVSGTVTVDSELPTAAALADAASNPTTPTIGAAGLLFNGTTWDRIRGDTTNGIDVDVTRVSGTVTVDSELPAAAALADNAANPTVPGVGAFLMAFDGTNWDRVQTGAASGGALKIDGSAVTQPVSGTVTANAGTGSFTVAQATASSLNAQVVGSVASDGVDSGNPVKVGGQARSSDIAAVANADRVDFIADLNGKQITLPYAMPESFIAGKTTDITGTTDTAVIAAQGAGVRIYVTQITVTNSHATVGTWVNIKDGTTTIYTVFAAAAGGGATITLPAPLRLTANTALNAANETTASNTRVSASGYKAP